MYMHRDPLITHAAVALIAGMIILALGVIAIVWGGYLRIKNKGAHEASLVARTEGGSGHGYDDTDL